MEPAMAMCTGVAALAIGGWLAARVSRLVCSLPGRLTAPVPGRIIATATIVVLGLVAAPKTPASADPVPPLVRLADRDVEATAPAQPAASTYEVRPGDSLWCIAATTLARRTGERPTSGDIARFWPTIHQENRDVIGDDPDLILPGQRLTLPES
jgi:nucleoid-associated protein YgaU